MSLSEYRKKIKMASRHTFVEGQDVYSDFYGRGKILSTNGEPSINEDHNKKWPLVVCFNDDESFLVTFNKYGWYNFTSPDPAKDIRPLRAQEIVRPVLSANEKLITTSEAFWMLACTAAGFVMGVLAVMGIHHG